jgi:hypothetical protein
MLTQGQLQTFARQGWVVVPDVVPAEALAVANAAVDAMIAADPPPATTTGPHFYWPTPTPPHPLLSALLDTPARGMTEALVSPLQLGEPEQVQVSLNIPPHPNIPGGPHVDGLTPTEPDGRPGTFTMLAGIFLTDQTERSSGNLWVWPGTHLGAGRWLAEHGADALTGIVAAGDSYPPIDLPEPEQVVGPAGSLLFAHYLLAHNIGNNDSSAVRRCLYYRLRTTGHRADWKAHVTDPLVEFAPVREAL